MKSSVLNKLFTILVIVFAVQGCKGTGSNTVETNVGSILEPVSITSSVDYDIGEIITTEDPTVVTITIKNNSSDEIREMNYDFDKSSGIFDFVPDTDGVTAMPGYGGSCIGSLPSGKSCTIKLNLIPRKQGEFTIQGKISYLNRVDSQTKPITYHLISGEPASLVFTNDKSNYNFGTLEQTEAIERFQDFEVTNTGGLPARNLSVSVNNDDINGAYSLVSTDCPAKLKMKEICHLRVSYVPKNNNYSDPETIYTGQAIFNYIKDPSGNTGNLNGYLSFTSSTIEAKFKTNYAQVDFGSIVTGNKEMRMIKVTNMGYREGTIKQLKLKKSDGTVAATCVKGTDSILNCGATLYDFPFKIEDNSGCFDNDVPSYLSTSGGSPSCIFKVTYWPSIDYLAGSQSIHNFDASTISLTYDSHWKGLTNLVAKDNMFNITATFLAKGLLSLTRIDVDGNTILASDITSTNGQSTVNLGRLAKIAAGYSSIYYSVKFYLKNNGEVEANFKKLLDGATTPNTIIDINESSPGVMVSRDLNEYYKSIKQDNCLAIPAGSECAISFYLSPVKKANQTLEDALMYDDISNPFSKFKAFDLTYTDGSSFNDDGSAITTRTYTTKLISQLIAKGKLLFSPATSYNLGSNILFGNKSVKTLLLKNIGTGKISALQYKASNTLEVPSEGVSTIPSGAATGADNYPNRISSYASNSESLPGGADLDCYDIIRPSAATFPFAADAGKILDEGKTCALRIEAKYPKNATALFSAYSTALDYKRIWDYGINNTIDMWMPNMNSVPAYTAKIDYWDGDDNSLSDPKSYSFFGYKSTSDPISLTSTWTSPASLTISKTEPVASSLVFRPELTYPPINATFPAISTAAGTSNPITLLTNAELATGTNISGTVLRTTAIKNYYKSFGSTYYSSSVNTKYIYVGSFKKSTDYFSTATYVNMYAEIISQARVVDAGGDTGFSVYKFQNLTGVNVYNAITSGTTTFDIIFKVNIATPGIYQHCYDVLYTGALGTKNHKTCLVARVLDDVPALQVDYKNNDVTWNTSTNQFDVTPDASFSTFKSPANKLSVCDSYNSCGTPALADELLSFSTVASTPGTCISAKNCQYDKKVIKLTNTSTVTMSDFKFDLTLLPGAGYVANSSLLYLMNATECSNLTNYFTNIQNKFAICTSEINACNNLAPGASCNINVYYTPTAVSSANSNNMFVLSYRTDDRNSTYAGAYSYANQYIPIKFEGVNSASPLAYEYMRKGIDGVSDASIPATATSKQTISASETAGNWADPTVPNTSEATSYPLKIGTYAIGYTAASTVVNSYYVLDSNPKILTMYVNLKNTTATRISFLRANPNPTTATWNQVYPEWNYSTGQFNTYNSKYGASKAVIYATEGCFYGEVKSDNGVAANSKGFNSTTESIAAQRCQLRVDFSGDITYSSCNATTKAKTVSIGGDIDSNCNPYVYKIPFWSYKRSTSLFFKLHIRDFIEPTRSSYTGAISNITSTFINATTARITFDMPTTVASNLSTIGTISKYRIFWAKDSANLRTSEIFKTTPSTANLCYADTTDATLPKTITLSTCTNSAFTISPGKYWYIKIMAISTLNSSHPNKTEVSTFITDPKIPLIMVATPNTALLTYVDALKSFVDNGLIDTSTPYTYTGAQAKCSNASNNLSIANGASNVANPRALINFNVWTYIRNGVVPSNTSYGYTAMGPGYVPHWLNDAAVAINSSSVKLYNGSNLTGGFPSFVVTNATATNTTYLISYNKGCTTSSCNNLNVVVGGDNEFSIANGVLYTYPANKSGFTRCYVPIICPANTGYSLSNTASCFLKF